MDDTDYETTLAVNKSSSRLRFNCAEELVGLDARMGMLLGRGQLAADENPFGPKLLCEALLEGMDKLGVERKVQLVLLNQFDLLAAVVAAILVAVLAFLSQKTALGRALRAVADDHQAATAVGIPLQTIWVMVWSVAGIVALVLAAAVLVVGQADDDGAAGVVRSVGHGDP